MKLWANFVNKMDTKSQILIIEFPIFVELKIIYYE